MHFEIKTPVQHSDLITETSTFSVSIEINSHFKVHILIKYEISRF